MKAQFDGAYNLLPVGTCLHNGQYRIERHLASGGFGNTYEAADLMLERRVAIKEFYPKAFCGRVKAGGEVTLLSTDNAEMFSQLRAKFRKEAVRLSQLNNRHIVRVLTYFEERGTAFYVMDYLQGESLSARMKRTGRPLSESEALRYLGHVLDALAEVHAQNIWHLDLKPANIMVNERNEAVLIDFGASKQLQTADGYTISTSQNVAYTQGYAPLELVSGEMSKFGPWTDLYSLGATLYALLTGGTPPTAASIMDDGLPGLPSVISSFTQELIAWMMQPAKGRRPQSIQEVQARLQPTAAAPTESLEPEATVLNVNVENVNPKTTDVGAEQKNLTQAQETVVVHQSRSKKLSIKWWLVSAVALLIVMVLGAYQWWDVPEEKVPAPIEEVPTNLAPPSALRDSLAKADSVEIKPEAEPKKEERKPTSSSGSARKSKPRVTLPGAQGNKGKGSSSGLTLKPTGGTAGGDGKQTPSPSGGSSSENDKINSRDTGTGSSSQTGGKSI